MPFQKGQPRPPGAGRKKGSVNRATVAAILDKFRCDPIEGMIRLAQDKHQAAALRARMYAELAKYRWPTLRAIEVSGPAEIPAPDDGTGLWIHARGRKLHVHLGEQTTETVLLR